jgi:uncharacterized protein involved in exopolysaccharide biosynthesis
METILNIPSGISIAELKTLQERAWKRRQLEKKRKKMQQEVRRNTRRRERVIRERQSGYLFLAKLRIEERNKEKEQLRQESKKFTTDSPEVQRLLNLVVNGTVN